MSKDNSHKGLKDFYETGSKKGIQPDHAPKLARMLGVSRKALSEFVNEKASLSPEMAIRISKATNTSPESWMNMQQKLTLWIAQQNEPSNVIPFPLDAVKEG